jgi:hypothetical protein
VDQEVKVRPPVRVLAGSLDRVVDVLPPQGTLVLSGDRVLVERCLPTEVATLSHERERCTGGTIHEVVVLVPRRRDVRDGASIASSVAPSR